jgi:N-glycosylase/DNA lyase
MENLAKEIKALKNKSIKETVNRRLKEFESFKSKDTKEWFSELCFCILTANSKAATALAIQKELGSKGFCTLCQKEIRDSIRNNKHRFHNNKSKYIVEARHCIDIKNKIRQLIKESGEAGAREWLVDNVKGLGYKEASHFLRNVGFKNLAILDRHILNLMIEDRILKEKPKSLNKKNYLEIEQKFKHLSQELKMHPAELDLYMWYMKTGEVLK